MLPAHELTLAIRMAGITDGPAILALWREIAWLPTGSPEKELCPAIPNFVDAEEALLGVMRIHRAGTLQ